MTPDPKAPLPKEVEAALTSIELGDAWVTPSELDDCARVLRAHITAQAEKIAALEAELLDHKCNDSEYEMNESYIEELIAENERLCGVLADISEKEWPTVSALKVMARSALSQEGSDDGEH